MAQSYLRKLERDDLDLHVLFYSLLDKKWLLLGICFFIVALSLSYIAITPTKYQATVLLEVHHKVENSLGAISNSREPRSDTVNEEPITLQVALIYSKFILEPVIRSLSLDVDILSAKDLPLPHIQYLQVPEAFLKKRLRLEIDQPNHFRLRSSSKHFILEGFVNQRIENKGFTIQIDQLPQPSKIPYFIIKKPEAEIIKKIRANLVVTDLSNSSEGSLKKAGILQLMMKGERPDQLIQLINKIALYTQMRDKERKSLEAKKTLAFLYEQLPLVKASLKSAEAQLNDYRSTSGKIDLKLESDYLLTHLSDVDKQLESTRLKKMDLFQQYTSHHPFVISLDQKIQELNKQREAILSQIKKLPAADQIAATLTREVQVNNNLYLSLLNKIQEQQVVTAGIVSDIGILSLATFADKPFRPSWLLVLCCSFGIGLILGSLALVFWQLLTRRFAYTSN